MALNIDRLIITTDETARAYLKRAYDIAWNRSSDNKTKTGAVIVSPFKNYISKEISNGYNHLTPGVENIPEWSERPLKYTGTVHAETDAISKAAKNGARLEDSIMYMPWIPCTLCYIIIKNSGIKMLVAHKEMVLMSPPHWEEDLNRTIFLAERSKFPIILYEGKIGGVKSLFDGKVWEP